MAEIKSIFMNFCLVKERGRGEKGGNQRQGESDFFLQKCEGCRLSFSPFLIFYPTIMYIYFHHPNVIKLLPRVEFWVWMYITLTLLVVSDNEDVISD